MGFGFFGHALEQFVLRKKNLEKNFGKKNCPVIKRGAEGANDELMTVTAWENKIGQYDETGDECAPNHDYLFRGMPLRRAMDKASSRNGQRGFNSIWELKVSITGRGAEVRERRTPTAGR